jgi:myo-inositol-1(or 4)-monophosphatase
MGAGVRRTVLPLSGTEAGRAQLSVGAGGDTTMELDRAAEAVVFAELASLAERGERFSVLSEEAGHRSFGADYPLVLVDPVDGSLNAKHGVPLFGLMLAVLDGPTVANTYAGMVLNLNNNEEWRALRKQGAWRGGKRLEQLKRSSRDRIELLGLESTPRALKVAQPLVDRANKIRILGSMAISIALTSAGGFDVFCAPIPVRLFDMAASLLLLREAGGVASDLQGEWLDGLRCDLETRTTLVCAPTRDLHAEAIRILRGGE